MSVLRCPSKTALSACVAFAAFAAAVFACGAHAATLQITPVMVNLASDVSASGLTLRNSGDQPIYGQVRVYRWTQVDGDDALAATQEVVASPPLIQIGARADQIVRLVRTTPAPSGDEQSFRILIDELPAADAAPTSGVNIRLRYSVPVFVEPTGDATRTPNLAWKIERGANGWMLDVSNSGQRHAQIAGVQLVNGAGKTFEINQGLLGYALAHSGRHWQLPVPATADLSGPLTIRAAINAVRVEAPVSTR